MTQFRRRDPVRDLISLREAMDQLFEESIVRPRARTLSAESTGSLAVDLYETEESVVVKTAIPGAEPEDIEISIVEDTLTIRGEIKAEEGITEGHYVYRERPHGVFSRSLTIPVSIESGKAEAEFEDGILTLTLPKAEELKPKAIAVKAK